VKNGDCRYAIMKINAYEERMEPFEPNFFIHLGNKTYYSILIKHKNYFWPTNICTLNIKVFLKLFVEFLLSSCLEMFSYIFYYYIADMSWYFINQEDGH